MGGSFWVRVGIRVLGMGETEIGEIAAMEGGLWRSLCLKPLLHILSQRPAPGIS